MNTKQWKDKTLNSLLMERFGYGKKMDSLCEKVHPGIPHNQYLQENELEEGGCNTGAGKRDEELEESAFNLAADAARDDGKKEFEFPKGSGKMHPVTIKTGIPN